MTAGWMDVDLAHPRVSPGPGLKADRVVVWNQHNSADNNGGTQSVRAQRFRKFALRTAGMRNVQHQRGE
jgi:hypothetical protein